MFLLYFAYVHRGWRKWVLGAGIALAVIVLLIAQFKDTPFIKSIPGSRIFDISFTAQTFHDRTIMWGMAWHGFLARPLLGWGPENFIQVFDRFFDPQYYTAGQPFGAWFDRAHSLIFDYLAETGALGFLSFVSIFVVFFWKFFKSQKESVATVVGQKSPLEKAIVVALPVAYLVQGLVLFDVLPIYTNVFFFLAFATYLFSPSKEFEWSQRRRRM